MYYDIIWQSTYPLSGFCAGGGIALDKQLQHDSSAVGRKSSSHFSQESVNAVTKDRLLGQRRTGTNRYQERFPAGLGKRAKRKTYGNLKGGGRGGSKGEKMDGGRDRVGGREEREHIKVWCMHTWNIVGKSEVLLDLWPLKCRFQVTTNLLEYILFRRSGRDWGRRKINEEKNHNH